MTRPRLFTGLSPDEERELIAAARPRQLQARELLARQGDPAMLFALLQVGHIKLAQLSAAGAETIARFIGPGDCFGAITLVPDSRYPLSATAVEPCRALTWGRDVITPFADRLPQLKTNILAEIARRMAGALSVSQELATEHVPERLSHALLRLAEHGGRQTARGLEIAHPITRQELAELTGATLFTISRLMAQWEAQGLLRTSRGAVLIVDPDALKSAGEAES